ncbi:MAG: DUF5131 family protein [Armatimonadetes bacterium]|nr:DUF5131 family protein [Armatimonadota bacterium]
MATTRVDWADVTENWCSGCSGPTGIPAAPNPCPYCFARRMAARLRGMPKGAVKYRNGFQPTFHPDEIEKFRKKASRWRKRRRVFVNSMSDINDPVFTDDQIQQQIQVATDHPQHTFMFLSKRPERYARFEWPHNAWLGATACDSETMARASHLDAAPAAVRFLSCEPLLEEVTIWPNARLSWIIIGAQTGPGAKPPRRSWVESLAAQADAIGVAVFFKDNLRKHFGDAFVRQEFPGG